ncbi:MAG: 2-amino-4-hydroxy-6-hydroxymethyldihydropteridine diphosphokinase [Paracoccaceae bacterium]|nr:2-amino-4-hydroxy-6-hydroxymethyldihydropteridine diphosphokinase [Paracoccaceae bacterium]
MTSPQNPLKLVALGSNQQSSEGGPLQTVKAAIERISMLGIDIKRISRFYQTPSFPPGSGRDFVNAAIAIRSDLAASQLLALLHEVEQHFGRQRLRRWGERTLDLDLIAVGDQIAPDRATFEYWRGLSLDQQQTEAPTQLILPHPRLQDRAFVLVPLADVAPDWCHPVLGITVQEMLARLPAKDRAEVCPIDTP